VYGAAVMALHVLDADEVAALRSIGGKVRRRLPGAGG
jgi:hypothetical protein